MGRRDVRWDNWLTPAHCFRVISASAGIRGGLSNAFGIGYGVRLDPQIPLPLPLALFFFVARISQFNSPALFGLDLFS